MPPGQIFPRKIARQGYRARPELGPVREPLVAREILLVYQGLRRGWVQNAVGVVSYLDKGLEKPRAAAEVPPESSQGVSTG